MRIKYDSHVHSCYSQHPSVDKTPPRETLDRAIELGLSRVYFSEHVDMDYPYALESAVVYDPCVDLPAYEENLHRMEQEYAGRIRPMFGVEVGLMDTNLERTRAYVKGYQFQQVLASLHILENQPNFHKPEAWEGKTKGDVQRLYLETMVRLTKAYGDYDCVTHITYYARNCPFPDKEIRYADAPEHFDLLFRHLKESGKGMEVNTSSYRKFGFFLPGIEILRRYREMGGEIITIGSDAHGAGKVGDDLDLAAEMLEAAGFRYYTIFEDRKPPFIKL